MKYVRMTLNYYTIKKFLQLILVALIPSVALAMVSTISSISDFLVNYYTTDLSSFTAIFTSVTEFRFKNILYYILTIAIFIVFLSEMFGIVERDMRVGDFNLRGFFRRLNNNSLAVSITVVFFMVSILVMGMLSAAFFFLWSVVFGNVLAHIFSMLTVLILFSILVFSWVNFFLVIPTMIITGQSILASVRDSIRHIQGIMKEAIAAIIIPLFPMFLLVYGERLLNLNIEFFLDIIIYDLLIVYYVVLMLVIHYEVSGMTREDLRPSSRFFK